MSVCVYSHFPHLAFLSCNITIVLLSLTLLINFLWVVAHVTIHAGTHTLMLSTGSHPGYENTGSSPGVSCMEKKRPALTVTHSTLHKLCDKGTVNELRGSLHSTCSKITPITSGSAGNISTGMSTHPYSKALPQVEWQTKSVTHQKRLTDELPLLKTSQ